MGSDVQEARKGDSLYRRILDMAFQGHPPVPYIRAASKLLFAGFLGVVTGWVLQPFFSDVFAIPYWLAYWPAVLAGFIVNLRAQIRMKNLNVGKKDDTGH